MNNREQIQRVEHMNSICIYRYIELGKNWLAIEPMTFLLSGQYTQITDPLRARM